MLFIAYYQVHSGSSTCGLGRQERGIDVYGREGFSQGAVDLKIVVAFVLIVTSCFTRGRGFLEIEGGRWICSEGWSRVCILCKYGRIIPTETCLPPAALVSAKINSMMMGLRSNSFHVKSGVDNGDRLE